MLVLTIADETHKTRNKIHCRRIRLSRRQYAYVGYNSSNILCIYESMRCQTDREKRAVFSSTHRWKNQPHKISIRT